MHMSRVWVHEPTSHVWRPIFCFIVPCFILLRQSLSGNQLGWQPTSPSDLPVSAHTMPGAEVHVQPHLAPPTHGHRTELRIPSLHSKPSYPLNDHHKPQAGYGVYNSTPGKTTANESGHSKGKGLGAEKSDEYCSLL